MRNSKSFNGINRLYYSLKKPMSNPILDRLRETFPVFNQVGTLFEGRPKLFSQDVRTKTIFFPPGDPEAAKHIDIKTPAGARKSVKWLNKEWKKAKTRPRKRKVKSWAVLAANRAGIIAENPRVSAPQRKEAREIKKIYKRWYEKKKLP